jgi:O-antigen/teichoic acid export membrane protein
MDEVGLYSMAYKISMVFFMITGAFSVAYQPVFFRKANQLDQTEGKKSIELIIQNASISFILIAFFIALFSKEFIIFLLDQKYENIYIYLRIITLSHVFSAIMGISSNLYYLQSKKSKLQLIIVSFSAVLNIILNYHLVPRFGVYGAAWSTVISMITLTFFHYQFSRRCYFVKLSWPLLSKFIITLSAIIFIFQMYIENHWLAFPIKIFFTVLILFYTFKNQKIFHTLREFNKK